MNDAYKTATDKLVAYMLSVRRYNTREWLAGLVDEVNAWAEATGERDRVELCGDGLRVVREGRPA